MNILPFIPEFHSNAVFPKEITSSFLALIPKKDQPQNIEDFKPIFLVVHLYNIISKLQTTRIRKALSKLISNNQTTFILNKQVLDKVAVVNKTIYLAKRKKGQIPPFQITF